MTIEIPKLVLIRGIPGSGKTTLASLLFPEHIAIAADDFFVRDGRYEYDKNRIKDAHNWCKKKTYQLLQDNHSVVVCNTFIMQWQLDPYFDMGVVPLVLVANGNYKNIHNIPEATVKLMCRTFEL